MITDYLFPNKGFAGRALIAFPVIALICCNYNKKAPESAFPPVRQFKLLLSFPTLTANNKFITIKDSQYIIYYTDLVLYKYPYTHEFNSSLFDSDGELLEHKIIKTENKFQYFTYRKGEKHGYYFDSLEQRKGRRLAIDSVLKSKFFIIDKFIFSPDDSLIKRVPEGNTNHEIYVRKFKNDKWDCDTNHLFFSDEFKNIDFSFSKKLDSLKGTILFKVYQISNGDPQNENFFFRQKRETLMEIKEIPGGSSNEIIDFWSRDHEE